MEFVFLIIIILIIGVTVYFFIDTKKTTIEEAEYTPVFKDKNLQKKMLRNAQICAESVMTSFDKVLNYTSESIRVLDEVINTLYKKKGISNASKDKLVLTFGSYFGQTFINNHTGMWFEHPNFKLPIIFAPRALFEFSPFEIMDKKFQYVEEFDLYIAYEDLIKQYFKRMRDMQLT